MTEAEQIAAWANVPFALASLTVDAATAFGFPVRAIRKDCRKRELVRCRWWIARQARDMGFSYPQIGRALNRDHTTVLHGLRQAA